MGQAKSLWLSLTRFTNKRTRHSRLLRRVGKWGYTSTVRANVFLPPPKVLLNGPGKSGTHLLSDCLSLMPKMMFSGRHFALPEFIPGPAWSPGSRSRHPSPPPGVARLKKYLERCPQGMFVTAHATFHPDVADLIEDLRFKHILLLRDPRDIAVSHALYMMQDTLHQFHRYYAKTLKCDEARLMASIRGVRADEGVEKPLPPLGETFGAFLRWMDDPSTLVVRFEDMLGARGGGDAEKQLDEIERIGSFVERPLDREGARLIARKMYGKGSLTFRKGMAGDWQNHFTEAHKRAFKEVAGDLLLRLGYEEDASW